MKLFKKLMAVAALAAICVSMTMPMSASAALPSGCKHVMEMYEVDRVYKSSDTVMFTYMMDVDDDGALEVVVDYCTEVTYEVEYEYMCTKCGYGLGSLYLEETTHTDEKCPNYLEENGVG